MRALLRAVWRWSWVATLPVAVVFVVWASATVERYRAFTLRQPTGLQLLAIGEMELEHLLRKTLLLFGVGASAADAGQDEPRVIGLRVGPLELARLDSDLPQSGKDYVPGVLEAEDRVQDVDVRYRGDSAYHWAYDKKSFRIRTKKSEPFEGLRTFNLVAPRTPEILNNHLSHVLAEEFDLVSPHTEMTEVFLNGVRNGLYVLTEQLREITLLRAGRSPGDLYSGDVVGLAAWTGIDSMLFEHPGLWEVRPGGDDEDGNDGGSMAPLERLVALVRAPGSDEVQAELAGLLDMEAFGRFSALEILTCTVHVDSVHNWRLYHDPQRGVFEPVVWDLMGWHYEMRPGPEEHVRLDVIASPLHLALHRNGDFLRARHAALREFFESGADERFLARVARSIAWVEPSVRRDPNMFVAGEVILPERAMAAMRLLEAEIRRFFDEIRAAYLEDPGEVRWTELHPGRIALAVSGRAPLGRVTLDYDGPIGESGVEVHWWNGDRAHEVDVSGAAVADGERLHVDLPLLARFVPRIESMRPILVEDNRMSVEPAYYELAVERLPPGRELRAIHVERNGRATEARPVPRLERIPFRDFYAAVPPQPRQ